MRMKYKGPKKHTVKLMTDRKTSDGVIIFSSAEVGPGDIAELEGKELEFAKLARCQDGSPAWVETEANALVTAEFKQIMPKAPSRRTSWKGRKERADAASRKKKN